MVQGSAGLIILLHDDFGPVIKEAPGFLESFSKGETPLHFAQFVSW